MPGNVVGGARLLDEEVRGPAQDVGAEQILDRVQDARVPDQLGGPGEQQVHLVAGVAADRAAGRGLVGLEGAAAAPDLGVRQDAHGEVEAVPPERGDFSLRQQLGHAVPPDPAVLPRG